MSLVYLDVYSSQQLLFGAPPRSRMRLARKGF